MKLARLSGAAWLACMLFWCGMAAAQIAVPPLKAHVTDLTGTLSADQVAGLERTLQAFETKKGSQVAVLLVPTTAPEAIEQYTLRVAEQWKLGRKKVDDGAILVVAKNDRALRIEVGYGLEGALNDATSKRIISEYITPHFKQGDFYGGIAAGIDRMIAVIDGEPLPPPKASHEGEANGIGQYVPILFMLVLVVGSVLRAVLGRFTGALATGGAAAWLAWLFVGGMSVALGAGVLALLFTLMGGGRGFGSRLGGLGGGFGGFGSGSGGGGFSGGGGSFGGGGASGRW